MTNFSKWLGIASAAIALSFGSTAAIAGTRASDNKLVYSVAKSDSSNLVSVSGKSERSKNGYSEPRGNDGRGPKKDNKGRGHDEHGNGHGYGHDHHDDNKSNGC